MKIKRFDKVEIVWKDVVANPIPGWQFLSDAIKESRETDNKNIIQKSVGYLVDDRWPEYLQITMSYTPYMVNDDTTIDTTLSIPWSNIVKVNLLRTNNSKNVREYDYI